MNWGLGHSTRLVPVIETLLKQEAEVILAADKRPYEFLRQRFPDCEIIRFPGFEPFYSGKRSMAVQMLFSFPDMLRHARKANRALQKIIDDRRIDVVISDNRYELYSPKVYSVFITHQLNIRTGKGQKLFKPVITHLINSYISRYDELWIPDFEDPKENLSGILSHGGRYPVENVRFTGPLSRFKWQPGEKSNLFDLLILLSGPEPQRTIFEQTVTAQASQTDLRTVIMQGKPEEKKKQTQGNITLISHADDEEMAALISSAPLVISRPGYSTIMDLSVFGKKAVFVPTPGQTEQEYLAMRLKKSGCCHYEEQKSFDLTRAIREVEKYTGLPKTTDSDHLENLVRSLLHKIQVV